MDKEKSKKHENKKSKTEKLLITIFFSFVIFLILLGLGFLGYEKAYAGKIYPGVKIAGYEAGGQTPDEIKILVDSLQAQYKTQKLGLVTEDNVINPTFEELGITFDKNKISEEAYKIGRDKPIWQRLGEDLQALVFSKKIAITPYLNEEKFNAYISNNTDYIKDAKNSSLKVEGNDVITVLSENGSKVDLDNFKSNLSFNLQDNQIERPIILKTIEIKPQVDEDMISTIKPKVENMVSLPIVLTYAYKNYEADAETIANWLVIKPVENNSLSVEFSDDKITEFIDPIAKKINVKSIDKKINASNGDVIEEGRDGLEVNTENLLVKIKNALNNAKASEENHTIAIDVIEKAREEKKIQPEDISQEGGTPGLYDGRYLEVNLSEQKLYAFEGTNLAGAYTVSTGKWSMPTPIGTRYIESKSEKAYSSKYDLYMPWWNSIGGGYGIHELPEWANGYKEGASHLGIPVSHGCIRLGVGPAEFIYNWAPIGTPVYIHK